MQKRADDEGTAALPGAHLRLPLRLPTAKYESAFCDERLGARYALETS